MSVNLIGNSGRTGRGRRSRRSGKPMSDINVTPMVDVMLVLLIVFMVAAPLLTAGVPVDLPKADARALETQNQKPIEVTINGNGLIFVGDTQVSRDRLLAVLSGITNKDPDKRIFVRGDSKINYGQVMIVIGVLNKAGYRKVALVTDPTNTP